jgi:hypothetical protein
MGFEVQHLVQQEQVLSDRRDIAHGSVLASGGRTSLPRA